MKTFKILLLATAIGALGTATSEKMGMNLTGYFFMLFLIAFPALFASWAYDAKKYNDRKSVKILTAITVILIVIVLPLMWWCISQYF